ncbi:pantetheine-phosphate adenylyltransferase [Rhodomicrobium vannielii ATCC 17100]|uniref:pantetheine-phosphate adenylyltransferase n=1 Tax=Rhodomicrobium vannielii TaxID=1069 RepID=UPI00191B055D|nr:pantetheine-phosphate adenylyltransferase [Rhodomicrobium vannielii]MBJ7533422.1 pantetheine-phosphate adenylyltransferase [Rhodomicrobium vannielii ATCC 17100]
MPSAFYAGSFDPPTLGHRDIMARGLALFDRLVVGVGVHPSKAPLFTAEERAEMLRDELSSLGAGERGTVVFFDGLTVDAARAHGAAFMLRGVRDAADLGYETQLFGMNRAMAPGIDTVFLAATPGLAHITATLVRQIAQLGGDVSPFVSPGVLQCIVAKVGRTANGPNAAPMAR